MQHTIIIQNDAGISVEDYSVFLARVYRKMLASLIEVCEANDLDALPVESIERFMDDDIWQDALTAKEVST